MPGGPPPPQNALLNLGQPIAKASDPGWYGNGTLWTSLRPPISFRRDGRHGMLVTKIGWFRARPGGVTIMAEPVRGPPARFRADVGTSQSYGATGFAPSILEFGRFGCWRLRARLGDRVLTVVLDVSGPR
jgi:hypothetical protein